MTKAPAAGKVKTRLTTLLTAEEAAELNCCFIRDIASTIVDAEPHASGIGCFTPAASAKFYRKLLPDSFGLLAQRGKDLSERLINVIEDLLHLGFSSVCLIGSDSPTLPRSVLLEAIGILDDCRDCVVLGPSEDGGYYLLGLKRSHSDLFAGIDWSTNRVFEQTLERAAKLGLPVHLLKCHYDVDTPDNLRRLYSELFDATRSLNRSVAPATARFLRQLISRKPHLFPGV